MHSYNVTIELAKKLYIASGAPNDHSDSKWKDIRDEIEKIINAKSDRSAANVIQWWGCWDRKRTATSFARRVREEWRRMNENQTQ